MKEIVFASHNVHKLHEVREILQANGVAVKVLGLTDIGCTGEIAETGDTIEANARQKAEYVATHYGRVCFADDTGLFVDALGGEPGVHTARYAGAACDPKANIALLLKQLQEVSGEARTAQFRTVIALAFPSGRPTMTFTGSVEGRIAEAVDTGTHGFGYDPIFIPSETGMPFSRMTSAEKNAISHRGRALSALTDYLAADAASRETLNSITDNRLISDL